MLTGVAGILLLLIGLLAIPITLTFQVSLGSASPNNIGLRWAFGLVDVRIPSSSPERSSLDEEQEPDKRHGQQKRSPHKKWNVFAALRQQDFRQRIIRFIRDSWRAVHKEDLRLRVRLGLGDPADTGQLWSILGPMAGMLANLRQASVSIEPEFVDTTLEVDSSGSIRLVPLQMIYLLVALLLSRPVWQGIRRMRTEGR